MEVMQLLSELNEEGTSIAMVTHSTHDATYARRIINLYDGHVVAAMNDQLWSAASDQQLHGSVHLLESLFTESVYFMV